MFYENIQQLNDTIQVCGVISMFMVWSHYFVVMLNLTPFYIGGRQKSSVFSK